MDNSAYTVYGNAKVTATPVMPGDANPGANPTVNVSPELQETIRQTAEAMQSSLDSFSDQMEDCCGDCGAQQEECTEEQAQKATSFFKKFQEYIGSKGFCDRVNMTARKYGVPPKKVAEGFFSKVLGTIGDVAGIAIGTVGNLAHSVVDIFSAVLHGGINMVVSVASALARMLTLNRTCIVSE